MQCTLNDLRVMGFKTCKALGSHIWLICPTYSHRLTLTWITYVCVHISCLWSRQEVIFIQLHYHFTWERGMCKAQIKLPICVDIFWIHGVFQISKTPIFWELRLIFKSWRHRNTCSSLICSNMLLASSRLNIFDISEVNDIHIESCLDIYLLAPSRARKRLT